MISNEQVNGVRKDKMLQDFYENYPIFVEVKKEVLKRAKVDKNICREDQNIPLFGDIDEFINIDYSLD
jgi:hypothetical protein